MKLVFIDGKKNGESFTLLPPGITIGRETDNDIVLEEEACSRYHVKVRYEGDKWIIRDLGSTNGTKVNGDKINTDVILKENDKITIGKQSILFVEQIDSSQKPFSTSIPKEPQEKLSVEPIGESKSSIVEGEHKGLKLFGSFFGGEKDEVKEEKQNSFFGKIDFFSKKEKDDKREQDDEIKQKKSGNIFFYIIVIGIAVLLVLIFLLYEKMNLPSKNEEAAKQPRRPSNPLMVVYEKQVAGPDNIFRYALEIRDETISVTRDDLKYNLRQSKHKKIPAELLQDLEDQFKQTDFMNLSQQQSGGAGSDETDKRLSLTVAYGTELNSIEIRNDFPPKSFKEVVSILENFSDNTLNLKSISYTPEEMKEEGVKAFDKANQLFLNYKAKDENLKEAIKRFQLAIDMLGPFEPKPKEYDQAYQKIQEAREIWEKEIAEHRLNFEQYKQLNKLEAAREELLKIMAKTDPDENIHQNARKYVIKIDGLLRKRK